MDDPKFHYGMVPNQNDEGKLERLEDRLYSRKHPVEPMSTRTDMHQKEENVSSEWKSPDENTDTLHGSFMKGAQKKRSFLGKLFIFSLLFFVISLGIAAVVFLSGYNRVSPNNVDISVLGPVSVSAGDELSLDIVVKNNNAVDLDNVVITVRFPDGTRSANDVTMPVTVLTEQVGGVPAGRSVTKTVKAVLFGEKDTVQQIAVSADYKIKLSTSPHKKEKVYDIAIKSAPVIMTVEYPNEVNSGREVEFNIDITSNTNAEIENVALAASYPFGFTFKSSSPAPYEGTTVWHLGTLKPLEKRRVTLRGILDAQNNEERTFNFVVGTPSPDDDRKIGVILSSVMHSILVKKPGINLDVLVVGKRTDAVVGLHDRVQLDVNWRNNLPINVQNIEIQARVSGNVFDPASVLPTQSGFYRSIDHTAMWDKNLHSELRGAVPGQGGIVSVNVGAFREVNLADIRDPEIIFGVTVSASRLAEGGVPEVVTSTVQKIVRIHSELDITQRLVYSVGPFQNMGPVPPKVDNETTYTVIWDASNSFNNVTGARAVAKLPTYVNWKGAISPAGESITYNPDTREIAWNIKQLPRGTGILSSPREVAFQISLLPSLQHAGGPLVLVTSPYISGRDEFTKTTVEQTGKQLTTELWTDPAYTQADGTVVK